MDRHRENISAFFTRLAYGLGRKRHPTTIPLSKPLGSTVHQTSLIFGFPDELILLILLYISPDPQLTGHYARFRSLYNNEGITSCHNQRVNFLRPLSATCRTMRLRLMPWVWERLVVPGQTSSGWRSEGEVVCELKTIANALRTDVFLASSVKFLKVHLPAHGPFFALFVKCLRSLTSLHTLEIGWANSVIATTSLNDALKRVRFPQVKALILPAAAHPLLRCCHNVEDIVCVVRDKSATSNELLESQFLESLASLQDSKVKRLAIPLILCNSPSRFVAVCPRLTELTVSPHPHDAYITETTILLDPAGTSRSAMSELVIACRALPDFDTLQILYFPTIAPYPICWCGNHGPPTEQWDQASREQSEVMKDLAIATLKVPGAECQEGERRKRTTVRLIELTQAHPGYVIVEECEV